MAQNQHKPVLYDQIYSPTKEQIRIKKTIKENRARYIIYNTIRAALMVAGSLVSSFAFTIAINALVQERSLVEVATEFLNKIGRFLW